MSAAPAPGARGRDAGESPRLPDLAPLSIISASRRTDIPAFHSAWLRGRLEAGFCHVVHPYSGAVQRVDLRPRGPAALVLWTRALSPLLPHLETIAARGWSLSVHYTVNGAPRFLETHNPPLELALRAFRRAAATLGADRLFWRFDPIVLADGNGVREHVARFARLCARLEGATHLSTISFVSRYGKTRRNLDDAQRQHGVRFQAPRLDERRELVARLGEIAGEHGIQVATCCADEIAAGAAAPGACIDGARQALLAGGTSPRRSPTRAQCRCARSVDIGAYDTCLLGCRYCYATHGRDGARRRLQACDPRDSILWRPRTLRGVDLSSVEGPSARRTRSGHRTNR